MMIRSLIQSVLNLFYPLFAKLFPYDMYAYLAVGAANTALNIILFAVFYQFVLPHGGVSIYGLNIASYTVSLVIAFFATIPTGFWLAKHFAFKAEGGSGQTTKQLGKYFLVVLQGLSSDYFLLIGFILLLGFHPTMAKVFSTLIVLSVNFLLQKYFTFKVKAVCPVTTGPE